MGVQGVTGTGVSAALNKPDTNHLLTTSFLISYRNVRLEQIPSMLYTDRTATYGLFGVNYAKVLSLYSFYRCQVCD